MQTRCQVRLFALRLELVVLTCVLAPTIAAGQDSTQVQNPLEVEIATKFEEAAPNLFKAWVDARPDRLKRIELGTVTDSSTPQCALDIAFTYEFVECVDAVPPTNYEIDVRRTDSILTPYVGTITTHVQETCTLHRAVPKGGSWTKKAIDKIAPYCLGKTFEECVDSGKAKPAPVFIGVACTGGPGFTFSYEGTAQSSYRWSKGEWEFDKEKADPPIAIPKRGQPLKARSGGAPPAMGARYSPSSHFCSSTVENAASPANEVARQAVGTKMRQGSQMASERVRER